MSLSLSASHVHGCSVCLVCAKVSDEDEVVYDAMHREMMGELYDEMEYTGKVFENRLFTGKEELFASQRCISRICEMRGPAYRTIRHRPGFGLAGLDASQLEYGGEVGESSTSAHGDEGADESTTRGPRFKGDKHFFGFGWWESVVGRAGERKERQR